MRKIDWAMSTMDIHDFATTIQHPPHMRVAVVCRADDPHAHFLETVAKNSRRNVELFTGHAQAKEAVEP